MKLVPVLVLALVACKSNKPAAPAPGSAAVVAPAPAPKSPPAAAASAPEVPAYHAPEAPDDEVVPAQAQAAGSAKPVVVSHDPTARTFDKLDADHDGKLTPDEVRKRFGDDVDLDGDGQISKEELAEAMRATRLHRASFKH